MTNSDDQPFPFMAYMIECHGFDAVFGGNILSIDSKVGCIKGEGRCCIRVCRQVVREALPEEPVKPKVYDIFGDEV